MFRQALKYKIDFIRCIIIYALLFALIALLGQVPDIYRVENLVVSDFCHEPIGEVVAGYRAEQTFLVESNAIERIELVSASYSRENYGLFKITLFDSSGELVYDWDLDAKDVSDNSVFELEVEQAIKTEYGSEFKLVIEGVEGSSGNSITFWSQHGNPYSAGDLVINGEVSENDLVVSYKGKVYHNDIYFFAFYLLVLSVIINAFIRKKGYRCIQRRIKNLISNISSNKKKVILNLVLLFLLIPLYFILNNVFNNAYMAIFVVAITALLQFFIALRKTAGSNPENIFIMSSLIIGTVYAVTIPAATGVSLDDQIHYGYSVRQAIISKGQISQADEFMFYTEHGRSLFNLNEVEETYNNLNNIHHNKTEKIYRNYSNVYNTLGHIPSAFGIYFGNALKLDFVNVFILGKLFNLICYSIVCYFAIKRLKSGKMIMSVICLFPTAIFLATNYGYDFWVTSFSFLSFAYFLSEVQQPEQPLEVKNAAIMLISLVLACGPKAIYFPLFILYFFIGKNKFKERKHRLYFNASVLICIIIVASTFLLPFILKGGAGHSDYRGGDVNSREQMLYIFGNPFEYSATLIGFLRNYLSITASVDYTSYLAYMGNYSNYYLPYSLVLIAAFTDKNKHDKYAATLVLRIMTFIIAFGTVCLISSALYISFTPVGLTTINGMQGRYLIPLLFPVFSFLGSSKIEYSGSRAVYNLSILSISSFILLCSIYEVCISRYI